MYVLIFIYNRKIRDNFHICSLWYIENEGGIVPLVHSLFMMKKTIVKKKIFYYMMIKKKQYFFSDIKCVAAATGADDGGNDTLSIE